MYRIRTCTETSPRQLRTMLRSPEMSASSGEEELLGFAIGKSMGKSWENPWENHPDIGKSMGKSSRHGWFSRNLCAQGWLVLLRRMNHDEVNALHIYGTGNLDKHRNYESSTTDDLGESNFLSWRFWISWVFFSGCSSMSSVKSQKNHPCQDGPPFQASIGCVTLSFAISSLRFGCWGNQRWTASGICDAGECTLPKSTWPWRLRKTSINQPQLTVLKGISFGPNRDFSGASKERSEP